jgi:hypothetical protein
MAGRFLKPDNNHIRGDPAYFETRVKKKVECREAEAEGCVDFITFQASHSCRERFPNSRPGSSLCILQEG